MIAIVGFLAMFGGFETIGDIIIFDPAEFNRDLGQTDERSIFAERFIIIYQRILALMTHLG